MLIPNARLLNTVRTLFKEPNITSLVRRSSVVLSGDVIHLSMSILQGIILARLLGLYDYGFYASILVVITSVNLLVTSRVVEFTVRYLTESLEEGNVARASAVVKLSYLIEMISGLVAFLIVVLCSRPLASLFLKDSESGGLLIFFAVTVLTNILSETSESFLRSQRRFSTISKIKVLESTVSLLLIFFLFMDQNRSLIFVILATIIASVVKSIVLQTIVFRGLSDKLGQDWLRRPLRGSWSLREWFKFLVNTNIGSTLTLATKSGNLWLAALSVPQYVGLFRLSESVASLLYLPGQAMLDVIYPDLIRFHRTRDYRGLWSFLKRCTIIGLIIGVGGGLTLGVIAHLLVPLVYGPNFAEAIPSILMLIGGYVFCLGIYWAPGVILAFGRPGVLNWVKGISLFLQIPMMFLLVPLLNHVGAAIVLSTMRVFQMVALVVFSRSRFRLTAMENT